MKEMITFELKSDLLHIYKTTGDIMTLIDVEAETTNPEKLSSLLNTIKMKLHDVEGTLQKDIFNCDYAITKFRAGQSTSNN